MDVRGGDSTESVAQRALRSCPVIGWSGLVWRAHAVRYSATDPGGSLRVSGRYHRGGDHYPTAETWPAVYTSVSDNVCTWEVLRHIPWGAPLEARAKLTALRLTQLQVDLTSILDLRDPSLAALSEDDLCRDADYGVTQDIGAAAHARGLEGLLVPSATGVGVPGANYNVIIFTANLRPTSRLVAIGSVEPRL